MWGFALKNTAIKQYQTAMNTKRGVWVSKHKYFVIVCGLYRTTRDEGFRSLCWHTICNVLKWNWNCRLVDIITASRESPMGIISCLVTMYSGQICVCITNTNKICDYKLVPSEWWHVFLLASFLRFCFKSLNLNFFDLIVSKCIDWVKMMRGTR